MSFPLKIVGLLKSKTPAADPSFKISIDTSLGTGTTFALPLPSGYTYNFTVNYGDGSGDKTVTAYNDTNATYDYGVAFSGQVAITGKCGGWSFNNGGDKLKITSIDNWGDVEFDYLYRGFFGCSNLANISDGEIPFTNGSSTSLQYLFRGVSITTAPKNTFNRIPATSVNNFQGVYLFCDRLETIYNESITGLSGKNLASFFQGCNIKNIPSDLFDSVNPSTLTSFLAAGIADGEVIPEDLLYYVTAYDYRQMFYLNSKLQLPTRLFNTANLSSIINFDSFMHVSSASDSFTGTTQDIWNYAASATSINAFLNQTLLTNYASIPNGWKGL